MKTKNGFRHQSYNAFDQGDNCQVLRPTYDEAMSIDSQRREVLANAIRRANVGAVYLVHGTFLGTDAFGVIRAVERAIPAVGKRLKHESKKLSDYVAGYQGNYTEEYARQLEDVINVGSKTRIPVHLFHWSSENHHLGRADGTIRLLDRLANAGYRSGQRILIWGHSHGGNVLALMTNLIAASPQDRETFFAATKTTYRHPLFGVIDDPVWDRVRRTLEHERSPLAGISLDLVTFGTPVRYGWNADGYARLLHFVHDRVRSNDSKQEALLVPNSIEELITAQAGDYIQHWGIAGTNFLPYVFDWRSWVCEWRLNRLLQSSISTVDLPQRLTSGRQTHDEGETLLVEYGVSPNHIERDLAGHAIYTHPDWMLFHINQVASRFYGA